MIFVHCDAFYRVPHAKLSSKGLSKNQDSRGVHKSGYDFHRILSHYLIWVTFENVECKSNLTLKINLESLARYAFSV